MTPRVMERRMATPMGRQRKVRLDAEIGTIRKQWKNRIRVVLVYPNHYGVAMASLGFQALYHLLNQMEHVVCERAFFQDADEIEAPLLSLESGRPLRDFDCIAFSVSYENDYGNILTIIGKAGLPLPSEERNVSLPLILAGGVSVFLNPEPISPFIDCFLLGEAEELVAPFFSRFDPAKDRMKFLLEAARDLKGVYVPAFYRDSYHENGTLAELVPIQDVPQTVQRIYASDIESFSTESLVITPETSFEDAHLVEVSRGCPHGCRFCAAGFIYRPPRFRPEPQLLQAMEKGLAQTKKIGLMGAAVSDLPHLKALCEFGSSHDIQLSFSSLRADALTPELVAAMTSGRLKTATIAPEAGSERMRQVINKGLRENQILDAVQMLVDNGIPNLKLYFMVGLPTETADDVQAIVRLVKRIKDRFLRSSRGRGRMGQITVSMNSYVPKPSTPFQWVAMDEVTLLKKKIKTVKQGLRKTANVKVHADVPRWAHIQGLLARGDRRVSRLLMDAYNNDFNWPQTFKASPLNPAFYVHRERDREELLPWDFIDHGLNKDFLWNEYQRARQSKETKPCPADPDHCKICGVCER